MLTAVPCACVRSADHRADRRFGIILWFASWLDTLPQAILIGVMQAERPVHPSFIISAAVANFPQAFASASLLRENKAHPLKVLVAWTFLA